MASLSISRAWEEAVGFAGREFGLLYPIALLLFEVPVLATYLIMPMMTPATEITTFQGVIDAFGGKATFLLFLALSFVIFVIQTFGALAITWLALNPGREIIEGFAVAGRRLPVAIGAIMLVSLGFMLLMLPSGLLLMSSSPGPSQGMGSSVLLLGLVTLILFIALLPRLSVMTPVSVAELEGPVGIVTRSWTLTKGHFWRLFGAFLLIGAFTLIVALLLGLAFGALTSLLVGPPATNFTAAFVFDLLNSLFFAAYAVFMLSFIARIYAQLAERGLEPA